MAKVRGQSSDRNTVKQTAENGQKSPVTRTWPLLRNCPLVPGVKNSRLWNGYLIRSFTTVGRVQNDSGWWWTFRIARATFHDFEVTQQKADVPKARMCHFFSPSVWPSFLFELWRRTFTIGFYGKKIYPIRAYDFGVQFPFNMFAFCSVKCISGW